jgi:Ca-activated chloride channel homolog
MGLSPCLANRGTPPLVVRQRIDLITKDALPFRTLHNRTLRCGLRSPKKRLVAPTFASTPAGEDTVGGSRRVIIYSLLGALAAGCFTFSSVGLGQEPQVLIEPRAPKRAPSQGSADRLMPRLRVDSDLVLVPVLVTDPNNRLVTGLEKEHFKIYDNKVEQVITHFAQEDAPVSIGLVFDASGSMGPKMQKARAAVAEFIRTANPEDEFSLVAFSDHAKMLAGFGSRAAEIENRLLFVRADGETALLDAVYLSVNEMKRARYPRRAILIISDGGDNASRYTGGELKNLLRESDVQVYSIGIFEPLGMRRSLEEINGPAMLDEIARQTGGRLYEVYDLNELRDIAAKIGSALRNQYVLGFSPAAERDGKYHRIQVKIPRIHGLPSLRATFRSGYYAR